MKKDIYVLTEGDQDFYPASITDAIGHDQMKSSLTKMINRYNLTSCFPKDGIDGGDKYSISLAINKLNSVLEDFQKVPGVHVEFTTKEETYEEWEYFGSQFEFNNIEGWRQVDSKILLDLLREVFPISCSLSVIPNKSVIKTKTSETFTFSWNVYRQGKNVTKDSTLIFNGETVTGSINKLVTINEPNHATKTFSFSASYKGMSTRDSKSITAVDDCYYGLLDPIWNKDSEGLVEKVLTLSKTSLKNTKNFSWTNINMNVKKFCYAYPTYHGRLSHIIGNNNMDYIDSYEYTIKSIGGINYYIYVAIGQTSVENYQQIFS